MAKAKSVKIKPVVTDDREIKESDFKFKWKSDTVLLCYFKNAYFCHYVITKLPMNLKVHIQQDDIVEFKIKENKKIVFITKLL